MSLLTNNFSRGTNVPTGIRVVGDFYDFKSSLRSNVTIDLETIDQYVTYYSVQINNIATNQTSTYNLLSLLSTNETLTEKKLEVEIIPSANPSVTLKDGNIEYNFVDLSSYSITHEVVIKERVGIETMIYNLSHTQPFTWYVNPVTLSDFNFVSEYQNADDIQIQGLVLDHGSNTIIDPTYPESITLASGITNHPMRFTIQEDIPSNFTTIERAYFELPYNYQGNYTLPNLNLTSGRTYKVNVEASWLLGHSTSTESSEKLPLLNRPVITNISIKSLYINNPNNIIAEITIDPLPSAGNANPATKLWFNFYNSNGNLVAKAGGDLGIIITPTNNVYQLKLSDISIISGGGLLNDTDYKVKAVVKYTTNHYRTSSSSYPQGAANYINFPKSFPEIVSNTNNSLYTIDPTKKILTISVKNNQAYFLYAPNSMNGIKFHFFDESISTTNPVASTTSYTFVNSATDTNSVPYDILLSDVTPGTLVNDKNYRIKAELTLVKHDTSIEKRSSVLNTIAPYSDNVNFPKSFPEIVSNTKNSLYTIDSTQEILTISVKNNQAYFLYAPNSMNGIKFHFFDESISTTNPVASTTSYTFVNSATDTNSVPYDILLSDVTPGTLVNDKNYRIKAEVTLVKHDTSIEKRSSVLQTIVPYSDNVNFIRRTPFITSSTSYDLQVDGEGESVEQIGASIVINKELYELVAPNSTNGIRFLIYNSSGTTLIATSAYYNFLNSSINSTTQYNLRIRDITTEAGQLALSNGTTYQVKAEVSIITHSGNTELRLSSEFSELQGSQDVAPITSVTINNTWALATNDIPSSSSTRFNSSPIIGVSGHFKKNTQFNGGSNTKHLDVGTTEFKLQYKVDNGAWNNVTKAVLLQKLSNESLHEAVSRVGAASIVSSSNGQYPNIIGAGPGPSQESMVFYIPQQQVTGINAFTESNKVTIQVTIVDTINIWQSVGGGSSPSRESNNLQLINKITNYNFTTGSANEPWNTSNGSNLLINIPVSWGSIHAHSVKVGYKYASGDSYTYQTFTFTENFSLVTIDVNPNNGTTLYYSVAYIVKNVNISANATTEGLTIEKNVPNKFYPTSSDYSITNTSYSTFNTGAKSSVTFNVAFSPALTTRIDGINVYLTSPNTTQGSNITKTRIASYLSSQSGTKTIQLLYTNSPSTINYAKTLDNNTLLNVMNASGVITSTGPAWGDFDMANITFEAYRDSRTISSNAVYGTTNYVESGPSNFDKPIWNVPVLNSPSFNGPVSLEGGVRNSSNATKLSWTQSSDTNGVNFTYDFTMMKNNVSVPLIHNDIGLTTNQKILNIDVSANDKYNATLAVVFDPQTLGSIREVSYKPDRIEFNTIYVDVSNISISVNPPNDTSKLNLSFTDAVVSGNSVTTGGSENASFSTNIVEQYVIFSTTNPTNALARLAPIADNPIERIVSPQVNKEYILPVTSLATNYSFFMRLQAVVKYKVTSYTYTISSGVVNPPESVEIKTTPNNMITDQTSTTSSSQYVVSSIPKIGPSFIVTPHPVDGNPILNFMLDANGLENEGFISVVIILAQDGTINKVDGEAVILLFPDTGTTSDYSNNIAGNGSAVGDPKLAGSESFTTTPRTLAGAVMGTHNSPYTLTIGDINPTTGRYNNSTLKMPRSSDSGFTNGEINIFIVVTTRRGTNFSALTASYSSPDVVSGATITQSGSNFLLNFSISKS